jgi:hypothetical protein
MHRIGKRPGHAIIDRAASAGGRVSPRISHSGTVRSVTEKKFAPSYHRG